MPSRTSITPIVRAREQALAALRGSHRTPGRCPTTELLIAESTSPDARLLVERLLRLVEQPHVVDRDRGLARERLDQRDLVGREQARIAARR